MRVPVELEAALNETHIPWHIEEGTKHRKVKLGGKLVAILPHGKAQETYRRALLNTISQIRRMAQEIKNP